MTESFSSAGGSAEQNGTSLQPNLGSHDMLSSADLLSSPQVSIWNFEMMSISDVQDWVASKSHEQRSPE